MVEEEKRNVSILLAIPRAAHNVNNTGGIIVSFQEVTGCIQSKVYTWRERRYRVS